MNAPDDFLSVVGGVYGANLVVKGLVIFKYLIYDLVKSALFTKGRGVTDTRRHGIVTFENLPQCQVVSNCRV
jgi:hypothetical protein